MKLDTNLVMMSVSGLAVVVGAIIILASTGWGNDAANAYLRSQAGGSMDTSTWLALMQNYIASYRQLGMVILAGGIAGLLLVAWRRLN